MENKNKSLREQWNEACLSVGLPSLTLDTAARIMAVLYRYGGGMEEFSLSPHFVADCKYIQKRWRIDGGETPDAEFVSALQEIDTTLSDKPEPPQWAIDLIWNMYHIKLR